MTPVAAGSRFETADDYQDVVAILDERHRVVVCKHGIQWILQKREKRTGSRPWMALHYCHTRSALLRLSRALCRAADPKATEVLAALPQNISRPKA